MKKLLSLLSVVAISGSTVPNVIAVSSYQKKEQLENINHIIQKRNNNKIINKTKIVIRTNDVIADRGVVLNNKVYFGSWDKNVYEYDPNTGQQKIVIRTNGFIWSSGVILNNKIYFGSWDNNVYEYDSTTEQQKVIFKTNGPVISSGIVLNNKIYFGSNDKNVYEYNPNTGQQKIVITANEGIESHGSVLENKVYFGSHDYNVYEYDPNTGQQKIVIRTNGIVNGKCVSLKNKLYIGSQDNNVYEYDPATGKQKIVIRTNAAIKSSAIVLDNKLYIGSDDHNVYEYDPNTGQQKIVITANEGIESSGVIFNNKLYLGSFDRNIYEYNPATQQQKVIFTAEGRVWSSGVVLNNKLYIGSDDHNVYEYNFYMLNLYQINNNFDNVILNELNYLNPDLDISELEIINKKNTSAIIKSKNNKYFDEFTINFKIKNKDEISTVNLNELIKKALFFKFRDENPNLKFKEIKYIYTNNLNFKNIEIIKNKDSKLLHSIDIKNVCFNKKERINYSLVKKTVKIPKCEYEQKLKLVFQITKGLIKNEKNNIKNGWTLNADDESILKDFININYIDQIIIHTLSDDFNLSNLNKQEQEMIFVYNEPEDEIELAPNEKATIFYYIRKTKLESILDLNQKITGTITAKIINDDNEEKTIILSIKEAMQILQKYSLLPNEITINEDNSITFNGKAILSLTKDNTPELTIKTEIL